MVLNMTRAVCISITAELIHIADVLFLTAGVNECLEEYVSSSLAAMDLTTLNVSRRETEGRKHSSERHTFEP